MSRRPRLPTRLQASEAAAALAARVRELEAGSAVGAQLAAQYPAFLRYHRNGLACALRFFAAVELPAELAEWALALTRAHMAVGRSGCSGGGAWDLLISPSQRTQAV